MTAAPLCKLLVVAVLLLAWHAAALESDAVKQLQQQKYQQAIELR
jgi:hypothetical protein